MWNPFDLTSGPWWQDMIALAGVVTATGILYRMVIQPFGRALWAAVLAAPKIAVGIGQLVDLLEGDVIKRLETGTARFAGIDTQLEDHEHRIGDLERKAQ